MSSYVETGTNNFTVTHAKHIASKVATDLKRIQRFYDSPNDSRILRLESEVIELLKHGYLEKVIYGFKRHGSWIEPTLIYTAQELISSDYPDDDPGKIRPNADVMGASFCSFLTYSKKWDELSYNEKCSFKKNLPFQRTHGNESDVCGYLFTDLTYSAGGRSLSRSSVRSLL